MTLTEFKDLVRDVGLETKDLKFDVMQNMFKKANATNSNAAHFQRKKERGSSDAKGESAASTTKTIDQLSPTARKAATKVKDEEKDMELVLYEFVEVLIRISFWRANPFHGINKQGNKLLPLPDCLHTMLHEVVSTSNLDTANTWTRYCSNPPHIVTKPFGAPGFKVPTLPTLGTLEP